MSKNLFQSIVVVCLIIIIILLALPLVNRPAVQYSAMMAPVRGVENSLNVYHAAGWTVDGMSYLAEQSMVYVILHR